jgi:hypothetical protein
MNVMYNDDDMSKPNIKQRSITLIPWLLILGLDSALFLVPGLCDELAIGPLFVRPICSTLFRATIIFSCIYVAMKIKQNIQQ